MTIVDPQIGTSTNWTITNATVDVYGGTTEISAKSTGVPSVRSQGVNVFTGTEGQTFACDMSGEGNGGSFTWQLRLVLAADGTVLAEQSIASATHLEYVVTAATAGQSMMIEIGTDTAPGSSSYYLDYDNATFTLTVDDPVDPPDPVPVVASGVYRDRVGVAWTHGGTEHTQTFPAAVWPLGTDYTVGIGLGGVVSSRYRMVLKPVVPIPVFGVTGLRIAWGEYTGDGALYIDGAVEHHKIGGRLHHYELTSKAVSG